MPLEFDPPHPGGMADKSFSVGNPVPCQPSPERTAEADGKTMGFSRPFGTGPLWLRTQR